MRTIIVGIALVIMSGVLSSAVAMDPSECSEAFLTSYKKNRKPSQKTQARDAMFKAKRMSMNEWRCNNAADELGRWKDKRRGYEACGDFDRAAIIRRNEADTTQRIELFARAAGIDPKSCF